MCGVIDGKGQQWEHCNFCGRWVKIQQLKYEQPTKEFEHGRDLCPGCFDYLHGHYTRYYYIEYSGPCQGYEKLTFPIDYRGYVKKFMSADDAIEWLYATYARKVWQYCEVKFMLK